MKNKIEKTIKARCPYCDIALSDKVLAIHVDRCPKNPKNMKKKQPEPEEMISCEKCGKSIPISKKGKHKCSKKDLEAFKKAQEGKKTGTKKK